MKVQHNFFVLPSLCGAFFFVMMWSVEDIFYFFVLVPKDWHFKVE